MNTLNILKKGYIVADKYKIHFPIGGSYYSQSYRVKDNKDNIKQIDIINLASLSSSFFDESGKLIQISLLKNVKHPNISRLREEGQIIIENQKYAYLVYDFISGETFADRLKREITISPYEAVSLIIGLLEAIDYLHNLPEVIVHNGISPNTVLIDLSKKKTKTILSGFDQARAMYNKNQNISVKGLSFFHSAPELLNGVFIPQSDLFSVGALLYHLIFGIPPWYDEKILNQPIEKLKGMIEKDREKNLNFDFSFDNEIDDQLKFTLLKALSIDINSRFQTANEFAQALRHEVMLDKVTVEKTFVVSDEKKEKIKGTGFDQIAGMKEVKNILYNDVIRAITEKDRYIKYGIPMLNGILLYGPPGCGKTFIAEKFAEEVGYNFVMIKPSDLQSKYINATQENIAILFKEAEKNAPSIIFIDELDAIVPSRESELHQMHASAVNEILAQMSNCGARGIFVIGATNRPEKIDHAVLRAGRIDKIVYLPPPDKEARKEMFKLNLSNRFIDLGLDFLKLADLTKNYVSSDIILLINEAAKKAERKDSRITMQIIEEVIKEISPSVSLKDIRKYEIMKQNRENEMSSNDTNNENNPFGFSMPKKEDNL